MIRATHISTPVAAHSARGCTQNHLGVVQACERPLHITSRLYRGSSKLRSGANVNAKQDGHCKPLHETTCRARQGAAPRRYFYRCAECDWEYAATPLYVVSCYSCLNVKLMWTLRMMRAELRIRLRCRRDTTRSHSYFQGILSRIRHRI